jgi:hypothetical protein
MPVNINGGLANSKYRLHLKTFLATGPSIVEEESNTSTGFYVEK